MSDGLPSDPGTTLDALLDEQSQCWARDERILVEDLLSRQPALAEDAEKLLTLLTQEIVLRQRRGETPRLEEYRQRFPHLAQELQHQIEVLLALGSLQGAQRDDRGRTGGEACSALR